MEFPATRLRRLRSSAAMRSLVRETHLHPGALIYPLFICEGEGVRREVSSMPGVFNLSIDEAVKEAEACAMLGIGGLLLFGIPNEKDERGSGAWAADGITQRALRAIKTSKAAQSLVVIADVCLCEYTSHGHCGIVARDGEHYQIENDASVELLAKTAASLAEAGADIIAPSDMMDGRVAAIRSALDAADKQDIPVLSYASKFASAFYGPFREARQRFDLPMGAYQVSGEYSMLQAAFQRGWLEPERAMLESLLSIRRAGADFIVTYFAKDAAKTL